MNLLRWAAFAGVLGTVALVSVPQERDRSQESAVPGPAPRVEETVRADTAMVIRSALDTPEPYIPFEDWRKAEPLKRPRRPIPNRGAGFRRGEDPAMAEAAGFPVAAPEPLPGALLPNNRIVAYYGNPLSKRMGVLGETDPDAMRIRFERQLEAWREADPETPVVPALHLVTVVAQQDPGPSGEHRLFMRDALIEQVYGWAQEMGAVLFLDVQSGLGDLSSLVERLEPWLRKPDIHLGVDPEFNMVTGDPPGSRIGSLAAEEINEVSQYLAHLVQEDSLPPKVLVVHRFTQGMVTQSEEIILRPEVQVVMHMDGWGEPWLKRASYESFIVHEPVQYTGFKIFYKNDTRGGVPWMIPEEVLMLRPRPLYIQYQ